MIVHTILLAAAPVIKVTPSSAGIPGGSTLETLLGGLLWVAFVICIVGIALSAIALAVGKHGGNGRLHERGREGLLAAIIGAVVCGGAAAIVTFFFNLGSTIH